MAACAPPRPAFVAPAALPPRRGPPAVAVSVSRVDARPRPLLRRGARAAHSLRSGARRRRAHSYCMDDATSGSDSSSGGSGGGGGSGGAGRMGMGGGVDSSSGGGGGGGAYKPDADDRAEATPDSPKSLTLAQQLLLKQYEEQLDRMSDEDARQLAIEVARQMMVKDNIMRMLTGRDLPPEFKIQPPDPEAPIDEDNDGAGLGGGAA